MITSLFGRKIWFKFSEGFISTTTQGCSPPPLLFGDGDITESEEYGCKEDEFGTINCYCNTNNCNTKSLVDNFIEEKQQSKVKSKTKFKTVLN